MIPDWTWALWLLPVFAFGTAALMISRVSYPHVVNLYLKGKKPFSYLIKTLLFLGLVWWSLQTALVLIFASFALSGVVRSQDSERFAFSIIVNGTPSTTRAKRVENEIGVRLASFSRGADALEFVVPDPESPVSTTERYQVRSGESFTTIARRHRVTLDELLQANPRIEPRRLQAGQWIVIPPASQSPDGS